MYERSNVVTSYGRVANAETNPLQQVVMLYDGAIKFLQLECVTLGTSSLVQQELDQLLLMQIRRTRRPRVWAGWLWPELFLIFDFLEL